MYDLVEAAARVSAGAELENGKFQKMQSFLRNLIAQWRRLNLPFEDATVIIGFSGGADSTALLIASDELRKIKKLKIRIVAAHFEHGLRGEAGRRDMDFVKSIASQRGIELAVGQWRRRNEGNLEQAARRARYRFLAETATRLNADLILTAHTMNDQAETFLLNLIRGSGAAGLGGISPLTILEPRVGDVGDPMLPFASTTVLLARPLLLWATRQMTEDFCRISETGFCRDAMNEDINFRRVWIRKVLIPMLAEVNPKIVGTLCRTAETLRGRESAATEAASERLEAADSESLLLANLRPLERSELRDLIRLWLNRRRGNLRQIGFAHISAIESLIRGKGSGRSVEIPGGEVVKSGGRIRWHAKKVEK
ncbi:MAG: tRNA lysidine(34) synthetase TilS [Blastocatellia bacterium]